MRNYPMSNVKPAPYAYQADVYTGKAEVFDSRCPVGMAYVPWQHWGEVYDCAEGLKCGTIFPELVLPFMGSNSRKGNYYG